MEMVSPLLLRAYETWRALRRDTPCPRRCDFDPLGFRDVLGMLSLIEIYHDPWRFKYRVQGTETALWVGYDLTGKFVDEGANKAWAERAHDHLRHAATTGQPCLERHFNQTLGRRNLNVEALVLPLASDGYQCDLLVSILIPHSTDPIWKAQPPRTERLNLDDVVKPLRTSSPVA